MSEKNLVPKRRFKEFQNTRAWEQRKLGEMCVIGDIDHRMPDSVRDGIPYLMTGDFIGLNGLDFENSKQVSLKDYEQLSKKIKPEQGDILFARYASVGTVRYVETLEKFLISYSCAILKPDETINGKCLFYYLQSDECQQQIELEINTGSQRNIGIDSLKKIKIYVPSMKEQSLVSELLTQLDSLITLHQRKLEKTKALKSAYLAEMFPAEGELVPKRRFAGFTEEWEEWNLGDITSINTGGSNAQDAVIGGNYPFFVRSEHIQRSERYTFDGEAILIPGEGRLGEIYHHIIGKFDYHQRVYKISDFDKNIFGKFIYFTLHKSFKKHAMKHTVKATVDSLRLPMLTEYKIISPTYKEQKLIATFFKNLDESISNQQKKLDKLNAMKQAYLQEMFV